ncbi:putative uncharacterized protein encoded by LINC00167 [Pezoporus occidentalis]|uniref:putative uncharacterized protein encoded by LINC00167 n=1 Tax=Pezoporus occidentalis TaxID=407982 RepID=UPI002F91B613
MAPAGRTHRRLRRRRRGTEPHRERGRSVRPAPPLSAAPAKASASPSLPPWAAPRRPRLRARLPPPPPRRERRRELPAGPAGRGRSFPGPFALGGGMAHPRAERSWVRSAPAHRLPGERAERPAGARGRREVSCGRAGGCCSLATPSPRSPPRAARRQPGPGLGLGLAGPPCCREGRRGQVLCC